MNCFLDFYTTNLWIFDTWALNHMVSSMDLVSSSTALHLHLITRFIYQMVIYLKSLTGTYQLDKEQIVKMFSIYPCLNINYYQYPNSLKSYTVCFHLSWFMVFHDLYTNKVKGISKVNYVLYILSNKNNNNQPLILAFNLFMIVILIISVVSSALYGINVLVMTQSNSKFDSCHQAL